VQIYFNTTVGVPSFFILIARNRADNPIQQCKVHHECLSSSKGRRLNGLFLADRNLKKDVVGRLFSVRIGDAL
jgi:hypothetical protein